jgi:hypothetical protein
LYLIVSLCLLIKPPLEHPLSNLPYNIPYDILLSKYCLLLEIYHSIKKEVNILKDENTKLRKQYNDINKFNLPIEDNVVIKVDKVINKINIKDNKLGDNNNINITNINQQDIIIPIKNIQDKLTIFELNKSINYLSYRLNRNKKIANKISANLIYKIEHIKGDKLHTASKDNLISHTPSKVIKVNKEVNTQINTQINTKVNTKEIYKKQDKIYNYYKSESIIDRIKVLLEEKYSIRKILDILNFEGYVSSKSNCISIGTVQNIIRKYL